MGLKLERVEVWQGATNQIYEQGAACGHQEGTEVHSVFGGVAGWQPPGWPANESSVHGVGRRLAGPETSEPPWEVSTNSSWVCGAVLREGRSQCECATWLAAAAGLQLLMAASLGLGRHDILVRPLEHLVRAEGGKS